MTRLDFKDYRLTLFRRQFTLGGSMTLSIQQVISAAILIMIDNSAAETCRA